MNEPWPFTKYVPPFFKVIKEGGEKKTVIPFSEIRKMVREDLKLSFGKDALVALKVKAQECFSPKNAKQSGLKIGDKLEPKARKYIKEVAQAAKEYSKRYLMGSRGVTPSDVEEAARLVACPLSKKVA